MSKIDLTFKKICAEVFTNGSEYNNVKRGAKRLQIPSYNFRHDLLVDGFPALSLKDLYWKGVVVELLWFLRGDNNVEFLNSHKVNFWNKDAYNWYVKATKERNELFNESKEIMSFEAFNLLGKGSVGQNYSVQWRNYGGKVDQVKELIKGMLDDINLSRLRVSSWNPMELNLTALPPCHSEYQVVSVKLSLEQKLAYLKAKSPNTDFSKLSEEGLKQILEDAPEVGFELHWNQRSADLFLGVPLNIASYALLAKILEVLTGFPAVGIEGNLKCVHFYDNQYDAARELLTRDHDKHKNCSVTLPTKPTDLDPVNHLDSIIRGFKYEDFKLVDYTSDEAIKVEMLAPKSL